MTFELVSGMFRINCSVKTRKLRTNRRKQKGVGSMPVTKFNRHPLIKCLLERYEQKCQISVSCVFLFIFLHEWWAIKIAHTFFVHFFSLLQPILLTFHLSRLYMLKVIFLFFPVHLLLHN